MSTKFRLEDLLLYQANGVVYNFRVLEIRIDHAGVWYYGTNEHGANVWSLEKHLEFIE